MKEKEKIYTVFVEGKPIAKQSFRFSKRGSFQRRSITDWQETVRIMALTAFDEPLQGDLSVTLNFQMPNRRRVDIDNLCKAVLDGMNKVAWEDDSQIVKLQAAKFYHCEQIGVRIEVTIT